MPSNSSKTQGHNPRAPLPLSVIDATDQRLRQVPWVPVEGTLNMEQKPVGRLFRIQAVNTGGRVHTYFLEKIVGALLIRQDGAAGQARRLLLNIFFLDMEMDPMGTGSTEKIISIMSA